MIPKYTVTPTLPHPAVPTQLGRPRAQAEAKASAKAKAGRPKAAPSKRR